MGPLKSPARVAAEPGSNAKSRSAPRLGMGDVRPRWSLWLLSIAHAVNHAQAVVLPLIYLKITDDFHVGVDTIAFLAAGGAFAAGVVQLIIASFGWRGAAIVFGIPAIAISIAILLLVRESGTDRAAAVAGGSVRAAFGTIVHDRDLRWLYLTSILGGGGRGLGVVNLFALIYLTKVIGLSDSLSGLMYGALIVFSVPMPLIAGWLSDRIGRKPLIVGVYLGGAIGFVVFLASGSSVVGLWAGIVLMGLFSFAESPQLQALLADIARPSIRDASFAVYFTLAFGVGSLWVAIYGAIIGAAGNSAGLPIVFSLMAVAFMLAAVGTLPIRAEQRAHENAAYEASLGGQ